jgi:hypothetical protein
MKIPNDDSKFLSSWKYVEVAKYIHKIDRVIRIKDGENPVILDVNNIENFRKENNNEGLYTSVWHYNSQDISSATRLSSLYFDIDSSSFEQAHEEAIKLYEYLAFNLPVDSILVYFTGKKGFHIECEAIALGINPSNNLPNIFRFIAEKIKDTLNLKCLDFSVYDPRRMWRLPGSKHQSTGLYKTLLPKNILYSEKDDLINYCSVERDNTVQEQQFSAKANEWFRNFTYDLEIEKERSKNFIEYFSKHGSSAFKDIDQKDKVFTPKKLLESCSAIKRLWQQAIDNKFLEHEARLFLCSILTYTPESIEFLHGILSNCEDYNVEKTNSHINDWVKRRQLGIGGRPYTCERANSVGVGCGECSLEKKNRWVQVGDKFIETDEPSSPSPVRFAYTSQSKGGENVKYSKSR